MNNSGSNQSSTQQTANSAVVNSYAGASSGSGQNAAGAQGQATNGMQAQNASQNQTATSSSSQNAGASNSTQSSQAAGKGTKSVVGVFKSRSSAEQAAQQLRQQGFTTEEINLVSKKQEGEGKTEYYNDDITDGALTGGTIGGIGGLLLGAGAMAIPGIGPVIAAGPIAAAISGVVAGGIAGGLIDWGIPAEASHRYEESVAQGNTLAVIRADAAKVNAAAQVLRQNGASEVESHNTK
ncbi:hypothetical protein [Propionispora vibrioides]|uniref:General stress protein 17M-like domain-containing protein n=1 Tax=Propionispora vibrioides TaxID=112903 RepID=A0A1H8SLS0_9FIRM|nr:hypothetical protein [Propionispora vibrioides]SEO79507.1 hypothetical protein SAMN04490178_105114 [Propionispora vibrioides]